MFKQAVLYLELFLIVAFSGAVPVEICECAAEDQVLRATDGEYFLLSSDSRAFCIVSKNGNVRISNTASPDEKTSVVVPGELTQFAVNDDFKFAYFVSTSGIYAVDLQEGIRSDRAAVSVELPVDFDPRLVYIHTVIGRKAIVELDNLLGVLSTTGFDTVNEGPRVALTKCVSRNRSFLLTPGVEPDFQLLGIPESDSSDEVKVLGKFNVFGDNRCHALIRLVQSDDRISTIAGIVSYFESQACPKGDALHVWTNFSFLDIDRNDTYSKCVALAVNVKSKVSLLLESKDIEGRDALRLKVLSVSLVEGLIPIENTILRVDPGEGHKALHPDVPLLIMLSKDRQSLRIVDLQNVR